MPTSVLVIYLSDFSLSHGCTGGVQQRRRARKRVLKIWLGTVSWGLMEQALLILYTSTLYVLVPTGVIAPRPCAMLSAVEDCLLLMYVDPRPSSFGVRNLVVC